MRRVQYGRPKERVTFKNICSKEAKKELSKHFEIENEEGNVKKKKKLREKKGRTVRQKK